MFKADLTYFPLVFQLWAPEVTVADVDDFVKTMKEVIARAKAGHHRYVTVALGSTAMRADARKAMSTWMNSVADDEQGLRAYVVVENSVARGVVTALRWMTKSMKTVYTVSTAEEGIEEAIEALSLAGMQVPPRVVNPFQDIVSKGA